MELVVSKAGEGPEAQMLAMTNQVFLSAADLATLGGQGDRVYLEIEGYVFTGTAKGCDMKQGTIGFNSVQRRLTKKNLADPVTISVFRQPSVVALSSAVIEVDFVVKKARPTPETLDGPELQAFILQRFQQQYLTVGQQFASDFHGQNFMFTVGGLEAVAHKEGSDNIRCGMLVGQTQLLLTKAPSAPLQLTGLESQNRSTIFKADFSFEKMGIGGLDKEFSDIFRRAFASRVFPASVIKKLGVKHVKGMLLYGPPGTGKTLIARQIGKMLNGKEPKIVNGPEILSKFVGESEKNIRELFAAADAEYAERGDDSDLHIIIFDEIDSVCKQRGSSRDGTGVGDTIVNQLLSKIDGVNALNNILVIGMTNRKDMLDDALLRPGRLEVQVEISLPDKAGRQQILNIHTASMREANYLAQEVDLGSLAEQTKNFSGAEIEGLVKSASSFAFARKVGGDNLKEVDLSDLQVTNADFQRALTEVRPAFGAAMDDLKACVGKGGLVEYGPAITNILHSAESLMKQLRQSERTSLISILLEGPADTEKLEIAATVSLRSEFPFIKLISPMNLVGMPETAKAAHIARVFDDAHKSPASLVVLDDLERLLEYVRIGPRFSNLVLQTILTCVKKQPKQEGHKLVIIATSTSTTTLEQLELLDAFNVKLQVPLLGHAEVSEVMRLLHVTNYQEVEPVVRTLSRGVPIKKLLLVVEMSLLADRRLDPARFTTTMQDTGLLD